MISIQSALLSVVALVRGRLPEQSKRDRGATAVEYGLMVALIAAVIAGIVFTLGGTLKQKFTDTNSCVSTPAASCNQ